MVRHASPHPSLTPGAGLFTKLTYGTTAIHASTCNLRGSRRMVLQWPLSRRRRGALDLSASSQLPTTYSLITLSPMRRHTSYLSPLTLPHRGLLPPSGCTHLGNYPKHPARTLPLPAFRTVLPPSQARAL